MAYLPKATPIHAVKITTETRTTDTLTLDNDLSVSTTVSGYYELTGELVFNHNLSPFYSFQVVSTNATVLEPLPIPTNLTGDWANLTTKQTTERYYVDGLTSFTYDVGDTGPADPDLTNTIVRIGPGVVVSSGVATVAVKWCADYTDANPAVRTILREGSHITLTRIKL